MIYDNYCLKPDFSLKFSDLTCGFSLPIFGNQALTRNSITSKVSTKENRIKLAEFLKINDIFSPHQIHSDIIINVGKNKIGYGAYSLENALDGDACITNLKNILLITTYADCIPVLLYDCKQKWIGSVHSGWRGTYKNIAGKTISELLKKGCSLKNIFASIGPGIRNCCYKVGKEFNDYFKKIDMDDFLYEKNNDLYLDLSGCVYKQLINSGINKENIEFYGKCTCCNKKPEFFSCRKDGKEFEGQAAYIALK